MLLGRTADLKGYLALTQIARQLLGTSKPTSQVQIDFGTSQETQDSKILESDKYSGLGMSVVSKWKSCKVLGVDVSCGNSSCVDSTTGLDTRRAACAWPWTSRAPSELNPPT